MEIISKKEAKERGLKRYFTGKACKYEHIAERQVSNGKCCECMAEYQREYYKQNKDKIAEQQGEYKQQKQR